MIIDVILVFIIGAGIFIALSQKDELFPALLLLIFSVFILFLLSFEFNLRYLFLISAVPLGFFVSWLARDELVSGRKWFKVLIIISLIIGFGFYILGSYTEMFAFFFIAVFSIVAFYKSHDKRWVRSKV